MNKAYTLEDLIKVAQAQAEEEKKEEEKPQGEKSDEEMKEEEKKKKKEYPPEEEMKTSALVNLADGLRATAVWLDKVAEGPVPFSEPSDGGGLQEGGQVELEPAVTGTQPHPSPTPPPEHDATKVTPLGTAGAVQNTEVDPLTTQTQAEPGNSTAMETGKTSSGPTKAQPVAAEQAKVSALANILRVRTQQKLAATPIDEPAEPAGDPPAGGGDVGYHEPTDQSGLLSGDAAATNMTPQQAQQQTQNPDIAPLLKEQPEIHAEGGDGTPHVDAKLGAWQQRLLNIIEGGE